MKKETKQCQNCKQNFVIEPEDFKFYEKIQVPPPTWCPECRFQRRLTYRNERVLYRRTCDLCGKATIASASPAWKGPIYCPPCWWSEKWDPFEYSMEYDFSKPFFEQFYELRTRVPSAALDVGYASMINSDYCHMAHALKNCYLVTHSQFDENCAYASATDTSKDSFDILQSNKLEFCLELTGSTNCYQVYFSQNCENCHNVAFSLNLVNCFDCFGCVNLRNKQYHIFNKPYSKEEYLKKVKEFDIGSYKKVSEVLEKMKTFWSAFPQKFINGKHNHNVSGDYIYNSKNVFNSYIAINVEDSRYCQYLGVGPVSDCYDYTEWGENAQLVYESVNVGLGFTNCKFNQQSWDNCKNLEYTTKCISSSDCFGCISLRKKQYCILNKQYTREEYEKQVSRIKEQMNALPYEGKNGRVYCYGEFFPIEHSSWGYNETTAQEFFPLTEKEAEARGYLWTDIEKYKGTYASTKKAVELPDHISEASETITKEIIECEKCKKPYRIIPMEYSFYRKQRIALARLCVDCRYMRRFNQRTRVILYKRDCECNKGKYKNTAVHFHGAKPCPNEFETSYAPASAFLRQGKSEWPEIVYCEKCYLQEVA